ncbi:MAG: hypothetical protein QM503_03795 [Bacteroidota bacterium]
MPNIQINKTPPAIALIGEGLKYEFERTAIPGTTVATMIVTLPNNQGQYLDKYFEISTFGGILKFYFRTTPDETGLEVRTWEGGDPYDDFKSQLQEDLTNNYLISKYYKVYTHVTGILLAAREIGNTYNIGFVGSDATITEGVNTPGVNDSTPSDYEIHVGTVLYVPGLIEMFHQSIGEDLYNIDANNLAVADVAEYLKSQLQASFTFPYQGTLVNEVENAVIRYYIRYAEYKDGNVQLLANTYNAALYAIAGRLKQIDSDLLTAEASNYMDYMDNAKRFLTWAPLQKVTHPNMPERLYFFTQSTLLKLMFQKHYTDGTSGNATEQLTITQAAYTIIEILCGTPELFVGEDVSSIASYDVWIADDKDDAVSEIRSFIIDHQSYLNIRTLIFKNSMGMYDMLHCTGELTIADSVKREEKEVLTNNAFRRRVQLAENTPPYSLNSGYLYDKEARLWLEEIQLSKDVNLALGDFLLPVIMKTGKLERTKDRKDIYSIKTTFEPDYRDEAYSAIVGEGSSTSYLDTLLDKIINDATTRVETDGGEVINTTCLRTRVLALLQTTLS